MHLSPVVLIIVTVSSTVRVQLISSHYRTCWMQRLDWYCTNRSTTTSPATSEIDCTGCPFSSAWSTRSVCWFSSVFTRRNKSTLQWWATQFLPPLTEVISNLQHAGIWRYLEHERRLTDKEVFPSLVRHCETCCRSLFVTHLWQWRSLAHIWRLFCFAEHTVLSIAPSWQFRL